MALVSVLMPMRNAGRYVRSAISSVMWQPGVELELIVIDDGSTDHSADVVRQYGDSRVRLIGGPCGGLSVALDHGLAEAGGQFVARCDADDCYPADRLAWQVAFLRDHPEFAAVAGGFATMNRHGRQITIAPAGITACEVTDELRNGQTRTHLNTMLIRADVMRQLGGFRPYFVVGEDVDLQLRLGEAGRVWFDPRVAYQYRMHDAGLTMALGEEALAFYDRTARHFQLQRRAGGGDDIERNCPPLPPENLVSPPGRAVDQIQRLLLGASWRELRGGDKGRAMRTGWRAIAAKPGNWAAWQNLASLAIRRAGGAV